MKYRVCWTSKWEPDSMEMMHQKRRRRTKSVNVSRAHQLSLESEFVACRWEESELRVRQLTSTCFWLSFTFISCFILCVVVLEMLCFISSSERNEAFVNDFPVEGSSSCITGKVFSEQESYGAGSCTIIVIENCVVKLLIWLTSPDKQDNCKKQLRRSPGTCIVNKTWKLAKILTSISSVLQTVKSCRSFCLK